MKVQVDVSVGELIDKISILEIKCRKISDPAKVLHAVREMDVLRQAYNTFFKKEHDHLLAELTKINELLWDVEDQLRVMENENLITKDPNRFIELARQVYKLNDERFRFKNLINQIYGSDIREVKSYKGT